MNTSKPIFFGDLKEHSPIYRVAHYDGEVSFGEVIKTRGDEYDSYIQAIFTCNGRYGDTVELDVSNFMQISFYKNCGYDYFSNKDALEEHISHYENRAKLVLLHLKYYKEYLQNIDNAKQMLNKYKNNYY